MYVCIYSFRSAQQNIINYSRIRQTIYLSLCITIAWNKILCANLFLHFSINIHTDKQAVDEQAKQAKTSAVNFINKSSVPVTNNHLI